MIAGIIFLAMMVGIVVNEEVNPAQDKQHTEQKK